MRRPGALLVLMTTLAVGAAAAAAVDIDQATAERAANLSRKLRCLVCQNQSIAESNADLAVDLRGQIAAQIAAGRSDQEILTYMTERYGDFVLYQPPLKPVTALLWLAPALVLVGALAMLRRVLKRQAASPTPPALTDAEREQARRLLQRDHDGRGT